MLLHVNFLDFVRGGIIKQESKAFNINENYLLGLNRAIGELKISRVIQDHKGPYGTIGDHTGPKGTIRDHTGL